MRITAKYFRQATGEKPENDDLERANCSKAGQDGHTGCGWCFEHNSPKQYGCCSINASFW